MWPATLGEGPVEDKKAQKSEHTKGERGVSLASFAGSLKLWETKQQ
jgi:hypothetical protein